jgi:hypothetical protein
LLFVFFSYGDQDDAMGMVCRTHGKENRCVWVLFGGGGGGRLEKGLLGRSRLRFEGNIKVFLKELEWEGVGLIHLEDSERRQTLVKAMPALSLRAP